MYMTNEGWEQNNQDYLKESYEKTGFTAEGYAIRKIICGGCGRVFYTTSGSKKYCHSYWCGNRANSRRQREYRQMHRQDPVCQCCGEKFTPKRAGARYCSNVCRQKDYRKRVTVNQVVKMITSFFRNASRSLKIRLPRGQPDSTRNRISRSKWPTEKAGRAVHRDSLPGARVQRAQLFAPVI